MSIVGGLCVWHYGRAGWFGRASRGSAYSQPGEPRNPPSTLTSILQSACGERENSGLSKNAPALTPARIVPHTWRIGSSSPALGLTTRSNADGFFLHFFPSVFLFLSISSQCQRGQTGFLATLVVPAPRDLSTVRETIQVCFRWCLAMELAVFKQYI